MKTTTHYLFALFLSWLISTSAFASTEIKPLKDDKTNPYLIFAIFHDDVPSEKKASAYADYIHPFITEFENITGRKVRVEFDENRPPYTNFNYKNDDEQIALKGWKELAARYMKERRGVFNSASNSRILLITNDNIKSNLIGAVGGMAMQPGYAAIASLETTQMIGHELGHTFNASHEDAEVLFSGWWCETFMFSSFPLRTSCLRFSDENRKRIKDFVDRPF